MSEEKEYVKAIIVPSPLRSFLVGWGMVLAYVVLNSLGAFALKGRTQKLGEWSFLTAHSYYAYFYALFASWEAWIGFFCLVASCAAWFIALNKLELSKAYPIAIGLHVLFVVSISTINYHEPFTISKLFGIALILAGVFTICR